MKTIAIISKNNCQFDQMEKYCVHLLYHELSAVDIGRLKHKLNTYIWSVIEPYVKFIEINATDFLTDLCQNLTACFPNRVADDFYYHTEASYSFPKRYVELVHCQPLWQEYLKDEVHNINNLGCLFSLSHHVIENTCAIIANKYDNTAPKHVALDTISKNDIVRVVRRRFFHTAILVTDGSLHKYYFQKTDHLLNQIYGSDTDHFTNTQFGYNLVYYYQKQKIEQTEQYVNKIATRINAQKRLYGPVLILHEMDDKIYANISIHELKRLNVLSYGLVADRLARPDETFTFGETADTNTNQTPLWSRYMIIDKRMAERKQPHCINCKKTEPALFVCTSCYRVRFCSVQCQKEFPPHDCIE